jgi:hypothetical protein
LGSDLTVLEVVSERLSDGFKARCDTTVKGDTLRHFDSM